MTTRSTSPDTADQRMPAAPSNDPARAPGIVQVPSVENENSRNPWDPTLTQDRTHRRNPLRGHHGLHRMHPRRPRDRDRPITRRQRPRCGRPRAGRLQRIAHHHPVHRRNDHCGPFVERLRSRHRHLRSARRDATQRGESHRRHRHHPQTTRRSTSPRGLDHDIDWLNCNGRRPPSPAPSGGRAAQHGSAGRPGRRVLRRNRETSSSAAIAAQVRTRRAERLVNRGTSA